MPVTIEIGQIWQVRWSHASPNQVCMWRVRIVGESAISNGWNIECVEPGTSGHYASAVGETSVWTEAYLLEACELVGGGVRQQKVRPSPNYIGSFLKTAI